MLEADHLRKTLKIEEKVMEPVKSNEERSNIEEKENQSKKLKRYCCKEPGCGKRYGKGHELDYHYRSVHGSAKLKCQSCTAEFVSKQILNQHMWAKHGFGTGRKCDECGKRLARELDLKDHMRSSHGALKLKCDMLGCVSTFTFERGLSWHMKNKHAAS